MTAYPRAAKYPDLDALYAQCSGPGALELAESMAQKLGLAPGQRLLDVGCNRGVQSCFLAREFGVQVVAIDPWDDRESGRPHAAHVEDNAAQWGVAGQVTALAVGVPTDRFEGEGFDAAYCTTALEMVRAFDGDAGYRACLDSILQALRPGALFALAEPMHTGVEIPAELAPLLDEEFSWKTCFRSLEETIAAVESVGFAVQEAGHAPDAARWWRQFAEHDPFCRAEPGDDPLKISVDGGRWLSFGYVIARRPQAG